MPTHIDAISKQGGPIQQGPTQQSPVAKPFTGWHFIGLMALFFGVVMSVNFYMAMKATGTWTGMMVKNGYVASQRFNDKLDILQQQSDQGWTSALGYRTGAIVLTINDGQQLGVSLDVVSVKVGRPAYEQDDQTLTLTQVSPGRYEADITLEPGPWLLVVTGQQSEQNYRLENRIFIAKDGTEVR